MSKFGGRLILEPQADGRMWKTIGYFCYQSDKYGLTVEVPPNFLCDFASIPRIFWRLIGAPATGKYRRAAIPHDWLYQHGREMGLPRKDCDGIFYEAMICDGVNRLQAWLIYRAVRAGGWSSYK